VSFFKGRGYGDRYTAWVDEPAEPVAKEAYEERERMLRMYKYGTWPHAEPRWNGVDQTTKLDPTHPMKQELDRVQRKYGAKVRVDQAQLMCGNVEATLTTIRDDLTNSVIVQLDVDAAWLGLPSSVASFKERLEDEQMLESIKLEVARAGADRTVELWWSTFCTLWKTIGTIEAGVRRWGKGRRPWRS
jgi:hypothetical protein